MNERSNRNYRGQSSIKDKQDDSIYFRSLKWKNLNLILALLAWRHKLDKNIVISFLLTPRDLKNPDNFRKLKSKYTLSLKSGFDVTKWRNGDSILNKRLCWHAGLTSAVRAACPGPAPAPSRWVRWGAGVSVSQCEPGPGRSGTPGPATNVLSCRIGKQSGCFSEDTQMYL